MKKFALVLVILIQLKYATVAQEKITNKPSLAPRLSTNEAIKHLEKDIPLLMQKANVPGMSVALVRNGKLVWSGAFGVMNAETKQRVTGETIFEANSLSKPVFAYAVLKLVDEGKLNLDTPLNKYIDDKHEFSDDPRIDLVTTRMLLSHTSGLLPSGRKDSEKLRFGFNPGEKFQYAPVGITYLFKVVEKITGMRIEDYMQQVILGPLNMTRSSYVWTSKYDSLRAYRHNWQGSVINERYKWEHGEACCSLQTNAEDYSKFVIAVMNGWLLKKATWDEMMKPQTNLNAQSPNAFWGLGWGLEKTGQGESFWHWGDSGFSKGYITAYLQQKDAVVFFANSESGLSFAEEILDDAIGGEHPGLTYLGYQRYNAPAKILLNSIISKGAAVAMKDYMKDQKKDNGRLITEAQLNNVGYQLLNVKKVDDAIVVLKQNTIDFPSSFNVWDSLAEAYMDKGDKELATEYYQKSLALNPANANAVEQLKKLKP
ncbi:MAG: CubicO group peptidase beta-lactamase class family [Mucilaginibacter sp.]|nr:CubicO group peptidase beta-lactamase class family [Mucilaginibacter sp.]